PGRGSPGIGTIEHGRKPLRELLLGRRRGHRFYRRATAIRRPVARSAQVAAFAPACVANCVPFTHTPRLTRPTGGIDACVSFWKDRSRCHGLCCARRPGAARCGPCLYAGAAAGLHAGRDAAVRQFRARCRPDHRLHDPEEIPALAGMPPLLPARSRAGGRSADRHPAGGAQA
ncbi:hypothetical protein KXW38_001100, partial [Aspergillus fumigatus]